MNGLIQLHQVVYVIDVVTIKLVYWMKDDRDDDLVLSRLDVIEAGIHSIQLL